MSALLRVFIQARMSSHRFPGKVLAPFQGQPLIRHVVAAVVRALPAVPIVIATSSEASDDPLAWYLDQCGVTVFRGPLQRVFDRFRMCVSEHPCDWILRLSADSPLLDTHVLQAVAERATGPDYDLITTVFPRTFPKGHNAELIRVSTFMRLDAERLSAAEQEHVTPYYYHHPTQFRILNVESGDPMLAELSLAVDTVEDLHRLEQLSAAELQRFSYAPWSLRRQA
jgi:spore coat polysaccharide biosynthesis protein SpsF